MAGTGPFIENTVTSLVAAIDAGADWVELDVVRTADNMLALSHNTVLDGGVAIATLTGEQCRSRSLDLLVDAFASLPATAGVVVEVKPVLSDMAAAPGASTTELAVAACALEMATTPARPLLIYSFEPTSAVTLCELAEAAGIDLAVGMIAEGGTGCTSLALMTLAAISSGAVVVSAHTTSLLSDRAREQMAPYSLAEVIEAGHAAGLEYLCWCPDIADYAQLNAAGVGCDLRQRRPGRPGPAARSMSRVAPRRAASRAACQMPHI